MFNTCVQCILIFINGGFKEIEEKQFLKIYVYNFK